jgi:hypothetical protein
MRTKNITTQNQLQNNEAEIVIASSFDNFRKKLIISLVVILLFFAYSDKIWAQIESLYNSSTDQFAGISTLMSATANNDIEGVKFFSVAGASVINQRNKGGATSLHIACREGNFDITKILIENGANVNIIDNEGWSPLMRASLAGNDKIIELLLKNGAKAHLLNSLNESALIHATSSKCVECINQIVENGNLIKNMDILLLKSQIADAFLIARSQENKRLQGTLESFLEYTSKMAPLVSKTPADEQELLPIINQSKIIDPRFNKFSKNYILKNQDNETLQPNQENIYTVLEDPNLPSIAKKSKDLEVKNYPLPSDSEQDYIKYIPLSDKINKTPQTKYKFKASQPAFDAIKKEEKNNFTPAPITYKTPNISTNSANQNRAGALTEPLKQPEPKKFKFKIGEKSLKSQTSIPSEINNNYQEPKDLEITPLNSDLKKNNTAIENAKDLPIDNKNTPEIKTKEAQETIFLIKKKSENNQDSKKNDKEFIDENQTQALEPIKSAKEIKPAQETIFLIKKKSEDNQVLKDKEKVLEPIKPTQETVFLIKKKSEDNQNLMKNDQGFISKELDQNSSTEIKPINTNQNNKKVFKFKKALNPITNSESKIQSTEINLDDKEELPTDYKEIEIKNEIKSPTIKKFKLKKVDSKINAQDKDSEANQEENI